MLSEKLLSALNAQVKHEFEAANIYLSMAAYCADEGFAGFSNFFIAQAEEERFHGMKIFNFVNELGAKAVIAGLPEPRQDFGTVQGTFEAALAHEKSVTGLIYALLDIAHADKNYAVISFLQWFVDEQVEEESSFQEILDRLRMIGQSGPGLYHLDRELGARVFAPED